MDEKDTSGIGKDVKKEGTPAFQTVRVLDVEFFVGTISAAAELVISSCLTGEGHNRCVSATGAHGIVFARKNPHFRDILSKCFMNLPDGMPGVWVGKLKGATGMNRCSGPFFFKEIMIQSSQKPVRHFFCGGNAGVAIDLQRAVALNFGNDHVVGTFCPPFLPVEQYDYGSIAAEINKTGADIVWIGLSTPKQEEFARNLAAHTQSKYIIAVGAAFDFHTGHLRQAPRFIQQAGLEWLFRLALEPRRLFMRYFEIVPLFIFYNMREFLFGTRREPQ